MRGCCANAASSASKTAPASAGRRLTIPADTRPTTPLARMHQMSPTFAALEKRIDAHVRTFRAHARFRPHRPQARDDGLLGERDDAAGGAWPAPASAGHLERHVLRAHAARLLGTEVRGSAARSLHGRRRRARRARGAKTRCGSRCRPSRESWCCSRAGCATKWRRIPPRPSAFRSVVQLLVVLSGWLSISRTPGEARGSRPGSR